MLNTKHIPVVVLLFSIIFKTICLIRIETFPIQCRSSAFFPESILGPGIANGVPILPYCISKMKVDEKLFYNP